MSWTDLVPSWQTFSIEFIYATKIFSHSSSQNTISLNLSCDSLWTGVLPVFLGHMDNIVRSSVTKITAEFILRSQRVGPPVCKKIKSGLGFQGNKIWRKKWTRIYNPVLMKITACKIFLDISPDLQGDHCDPLDHETIFLPILCIW